MTIVRTGAGWRVTGPAYSSQSVVDLYGMRMIWSNGPCLELLDLRTGEATVLQPPVEDSSSGRLIGAQNATLCDHFVFWAMPSADGTRESLVAYDLASGKRRVLASAVYFGDVAASGERVFWQRGDDTIVCTDMASGRESTVVSSTGGVGLFGVEGSLVAWATRRQDVADVGDARVTVHVRDVGTGVTKRIGVGTQDTLWRTRYSPGGPSCTRSLEWRATRGRSRGGCVRGGPRLMAARLVIEGLAVLRLRQFVRGAVERVSRRP